VSAALDRHRSLADRSDPGGAHLHPREQELVEPLDVVGLDDQVDRVFHERAVKGLDLDAVHRRVVQRPRATLAVGTVLRCVDLLDVEQHAHSPLVLRGATRRTMIHIGYGGTVNRRGSPVARRERYIGR
jgi:hypothetical protein